MSTDFLNWLFVQKIKVGCLYIMSLPPTPSSGSEEDCIKKEAAATTNHYQTALTLCLTIEGDTV